MKSCAVYYNEFDPNAAAWIRELIKQKLIAGGEVDERSITASSQVLLANSASCHEERGKLDKEPKHDLATCYFEHFSMLRFFRSQACERDQEREFPRMIRKPLGHQDYVCENAKGCCQEVFSLLSFGDKEFLFLDFACAMFLLFLRHVTGGICLNKFFFGCFEESQKIHYHKLCIVSAYRCLSGLFSIDKLLRIFESNKHFLNVLFRIHSRNSNNSLYTFA
jgi:hypothetical protein